MEMKNRVNLAKYFAKLNFNIGAEIGVFEGVYSEILCKANPRLKLYGIDSWTVRRYRQGYKKTLKRLKKYNVELIKKASLDAVKDFPNMFFDFVYIDASHKFDDVMRDIIEWSPKVKKGGIVAGHDYIHNRKGVAIAVNAYVKHHFQKLNLIETKKVVEGTGETKPNISWWFRQRWNN
jgi:predicted O-methyltransferase YrrM